MNQLTPIIQRPQDLTLAVVSDDILPASQILMQKIWTHNDWQITFAIIGESHRVRLEHRDKFVMEEMLACVDIPVQSSLHQHQFSDLKAYHHQQKHYDVRIHMTENTKLWQTQTNEIMFNFPSINGREAVTKLQWQSLETSIQWRTLHTYVCDGALLCVYSQSEFTLQAEE